MQRSLRVLHRDRSSLASEPVALLFGVSKSEAKLPHEVSEGAYKTAPLVFSIAWRNQACMEEYTNERPTTHHPRAPAWAPHSSPLTTHSSSDREETADVRGLGVPPGTAASPHTEWSTLRPLMNFCNTCNSHCSPSDHIPGRHPAQMHRMTA